MKKREIRNGELAKNLRTAIDCTALVEFKPRGNKHGALRA
jgi:hypothetical protein